MPLKSDLSDDVSAIALAKVEASSGFSNLLVRDGEVGSLRSAERKSVNPKSRMDIYSLRAARNHLRDRRKR